MGMDRHCKACGEKLKFGQQLFGEMHMKCVERLLANMRKKAA